MWPHWHLRAPLGCLQCLGWRSAAAAARCVHPALPSLGPTPPSRCSLQCRLPLVAAALPNTEPSLPPHYAPGGLVRSCWCIGGAVGPAVQCAYRDCASGPPGVDAGPGWVKGQRPRRPPPLQLRRWPSSSPGVVASSWTTVRPLAMALAASTSGSTDLRLCRRLWAISTCPPN